MNEVVKSSHTYDIIKSANCVVRNPLRFSNKYKWLKTKMIELEPVSHLDDDAKDSINVECTAEAGQASLAFVHEAQTIIF